MVGQMDYRLARILRLFAELGRCEQDDRIHELLKVHVPRSRLSSDCTDATEKSSALLAESQNFAQLGPVRARLKQDSVLFRRL